MPTSNGTLKKSEIESVRVVFRADSSSYYLDARATIKGRDVETNIKTLPRRARRPGFSASVETIAGAVAEAYADLPDEEPDEPSAL
jgi:hypothetical protein